MGATKKKSLKRLSEEFGVQDFTEHICKVWLNRGTDYEQRTFELFKLMGPVARKMFLIDLLHQRFTAAMENNRAALADSTWQTSLLEFLIGTLRIGWRR